MRVLVIEDEEKTAAYLKKGLSESHYVVDVAPEGELGLHLAQSGPYDLVILDIGLPTIEGWTILSKLRNLNDRIKVIILTACDAPSDKVKGLEMGADDYLVKPFSFSELLARIRLVFRRGNNGETGEVIKVKDLKIDFANYRVVRGNTRINLTPKEFQLLSFLARHRGQVVSRTLIAEKIWDINFDSNTNVIDVQMKRLRAKVDDPFPEKLITTIRGVGYQMETEESA